MSDYHKEMLFEIIDNWSDDQLNAHIIMQEQRLDDAKRLISELKQLRRKRSKRAQKPLDTGTRGGK